MTAALVASVALAFTHYPVACISGDAYSATLGQPSGTRWWPGGVAGEYTWCTNLTALRHGYTWQRGYAAFALAHELGHDSGIASEAAADCFGAGHASAIAYAFGLRGRTNFARLEADGRKDWGYATIPASCWQ
jgi:hypothetical protein